MVTRSRSLVGSYEDAQTVVVLTGAGISTDSGIPDFRGPDGLWTKNPEAERLSTLDVYMQDPEVRRRAWRNRLDSPIWSAQPNAGHEALVALERQGKLDTLVTQNIDGLHQQAGNDPAKVIEIHGTMREVVCMECQDRGPSAPTLDRVRVPARVIRPASGAGASSSQPPSVSDSRWWPLILSEPNVRLLVVMPSSPSGPL